MVKTDKKIEEKVIRWYWKKADYRYISKQTGVSINTISGILYRNGIGRSLGNVRDNTYYSSDVWASPYDGILRYKYSGLPLSSSLDKDGYVQVQVNGSASRAHRIIAELYIPNPENKPTVNHIDGNKRNNRISNLEWATYSENELHSYRVLNKKINTPNKGRSGVNVIGAVPRMYENKVYGNLVELINDNKISKTTARRLIKKKLIKNISITEYKLRICDE